MTGAVSEPVKLIWPDDPGFDEAVLGRVFNGRRPDRRPDAVLFAESEQDVIDGVLLARDRGWTVAVRAGGHSWAAWSVRDGGLLIDLGAMRDMAFDPATGIATAQPAVKGGDELSPLLESHGAFFNGGHCPSVGVGGFLLQGGQGWNQRGWGWAAGPNFTGRRWHGRWRCSRSMRWRVISRRTSNTPRAWS